MMTDTNGDQPPSIELLLDITAIKAAVLTGLVHTYREHGKDALTRTLTDMAEVADDGIIPVTVELVVALAGCLGEVGL
jgi:hypothetical protein